MKELTIEFHNGVAHFVCDAELMPMLDKLGIARVERASHVVPVNAILRLAFRVLRRTFGERGRVADWTRSWRCRWFAFMVNGPRLGPFDLRSDALDAERSWLRENIGL